MITKAQKAFRMAVYLNDHVYKNKYMRKETKSKIHNALYAP